MARLVIIGKERGIKIEDLRVHTLGPVPLPIAYPDDGLMKTKKAKLLHRLEDTTPSCIMDAVPSQSVWVLDAILQSISTANVPKTFGELATLHLRKVATTASNNNASEIHRVVDRYTAISIKNAERDKRAKSQSRVKQSPSKFILRLKRFLFNGRSTFRVAKTKKNFSL